VQEWIEQLNAINGILATPNAMIASHTPLRVGGRVDAWVRCQNRDALRKAMPLIRKQNWKTHSPFQDCLFRDGSQKGILLRLEGDFEQIIQTEDSIQLGSSALWTSLFPQGLGRIFYRWPGSVGGLFEENPENYLRNLDIEVEWFSGRSFQSQKINSWKSFQLPAKSILTQITISGKPRRKITPPLGSGFVFTLPKNQMPENLLQTLSLDSVRLHDWKISTEDPNRLVHLGRKGFSDLQLLQKALNQRLKQIYNTSLEIRLPIYGRNT
jgi:UDP-N-acetylmuramate dehydrogenase